MSDVKKIVSAALKTKAKAIKISPRGAIL